MSNIQTADQWIDKMESISKFIKELGICRTGKKLDCTASNLANDENHVQQIVAAIDSLISETNSRMYARTLLSGLLNGHAYGSYCELVAYDWFIQNDLKITPQVDIEADRVLGKNKVTLDGLIDHCGIYFDAKGFGFTGGVTAELKTSLQKEMKDHIILVDESWMIDINELSSLFDQRDKIVKQLKEKNYYRMGNIHIHAKRRSTGIQVSTEVQTFEPYTLAKKNTLFAFKHSSQFPSDAPFLSVYVAHPWFDHGQLSRNFADTALCFTRAFARRAFMQYTNSTELAHAICDKTKEDVTLSVASRHLAGMVFLNAWPDKKTMDKGGMPTYVCLNPRAEHSILHEAGLFHAKGQRCLVDTFVNDDY